MKVRGRVKRVTVGPGACFVPFPVLNAGGKGSGSGLDRSSTCVAGWLGLSRIVSDDEGMFGGC